jgi:hypothetical protein
MRRRPPAGLLAAATLAFAGLATFGVAPVGAAGASGPVCAGIVVDDGNSSTPSTQAALVASGSSDLDAMNAAGDTVTQNDAGLVCAINNYPANGLQNCLSTSGSLYYYWSYWQGDPYTNSWSYGEVGPAEHTVSDGQTYVVGWRYQDPGPDNESATKPSVTPAEAFAQACPGVTPVAPSGGGGGSSGAGGSGGSGATPTSAPATSSATPPPAPTSAAPSPGAASGGSHSVPSGKTTPSRGASGSSVPSSGTGSSTTSTTARTGTTTPAPRRTAAKLALTNAHRGSSGGDPALPILLVAVLIGVIGTVAWFRWRRRPAEE